MACDLYYKGRDVYRHRAASWAGKLGLERLRRIMFTRAPAQHPLGILLYDFQVETDKPLGLRLADARHEELIAVFGIIGLQADLLPLVKRSSSKTYGVARKGNRHASLEI